MLGENLTQRAEVSFFSTRLVCGVWCVVWAALETHSSLERASEQPWSRPFWGLCTALQAAASTRRLESPPFHVPYYENATESKHRSRPCERDGARYGGHRAAAATRAPRGRGPSWRAVGASWAARPAFLSRPCADASGALSLRSRLNASEPGMLCGHVPGLDLQQQ